MVVLTASISSFYISKTPHYLRPHNLGQREAFGKKPKKEDKMKYGEATMGQFEAVINKLGGMEGLKRFLSGELMVKAMENIFSVWKTLSIGGVSKDELAKRLKDGGHSVSDWAKDIMGKPAFKTSAEPHEISFVRLKVRDFGFIESPTTTELFARAKEQGLDLCEAEDGPHLRLALTDQPRGDWFWVAMEPMADSDGGPRVFYVERRADGRRWLFADCASPGSRWDLEDEVVFRFRK